MSARNSNLGIYIFGGIGLLLAILLIALMGILVALSHDSITSGFLFWIFVSIFVLLLIGSIMLLTPLKKTGFVFYVLGSLGTIILFIMQFFEMMDRGDYLIQFLLFLLAVYLGVSLVYLGTRIFGRVNPE